MAKEAVHSLLQPWVPKQEPRQRSMLHALGASMDCIRIVKCCAASAAEPCRAPQKSVRRRLRRTMWPASRTSTTAKRSWRRMKPASSSSTRQSSLGARLKPSLPCHSSAEVHLRRTSGDADEADAGVRTMLKWPLKWSAQLTQGHRRRSSPVLVCKPLQLIVDRWCCAANIGDHGK